MTAHAPRPELARAFAPFSPLIGSWDLAVTWFDESGPTRRTKGEWHSFWALDGRAVIDIWITPSRAQRVLDGDGEWGMSVRIHDPDLGAFRSTWLGPKHALVMPFIGRAADGDIVLEAQAPTAFRTRWIFSDIRTASFLWRNEDEAQDGTITVRQRFTATRAAQSQ